MGNSNGKIAYCNSCGKEIQKPKRTSLDKFHIHIWILVIISTLGFGIIAFLIWRFLLTPKNRCPDCGEKLKYYDSKADFPPKKIPVVNLLERLEEEKKTEENNKKSNDYNVAFTRCPNCDRKVEKSAEICTYCGVDLNK